MEYDRDKKYNIICIKLKRTLDCGEKDARPKPGMTSFTSSRI